MYKVMAFSVSKHLFCCQSLTSQMYDCAGGGKQNAHFFHGFTVYSNLHTLTEDGVE